MEHIRNVPDIAYSRLNILMYGLSGFVISAMIPVLGVIHLMKVNDCSFIEAHSKPGSGLIWLLECIPFIVLFGATYIGWMKSKMSNMNKEYAKNIKKELETLKAELEKERMHAIHSAKFAVLGEMSSGVAHEINNPMTVIKGLTRASIKLLESESPDTNKLKDMAQKIEKHCNRIIKIIKGLKTISRDGESDEFGICDLKEVLNECLDLCIDKFKRSSVNLKLDLAENSFFMGTNVQISQVLLNILNNAHDGISDLSDRWIEVKSFVENEKLVITITDSGNGIPDEVVENMFNPFFTTKDVGKGTGLGMSISKSIIEKHDGEINYCLNDGHTCFRIELPYIGDDLASKISDQAAA